MDIPILIAVEVCLILNTISTVLLGIVLGILFVLLKVLTNSNNSNNSGDKIKFHNDPAAPGGGFLEIPDTPEGHDFLSRMTQRAAANKVVGDILKGGKLPQPEEEEEEESKDKTPHGQYV